MRNRRRVFFQSSKQRREAWRADEQIARYLLIAGMVAVFLLVGVGGWAANARINGAVIATGVLKVQSFSKSIQHLEGGLIKEILVKDGDKVSAGDVLIRLDPSDLADQIRGEESQAKSKESQIKLLLAEMQDLKELEQKGLVQKTRVMALERQVAGLMGEKTQHQADADRLRSRLARLEIRAPIDGIVHGLAFHTLRGVVAPGQEVLKIVPQFEELVVEARVSPNDIDQVAPGQAAFIRLSSFNLNTTPEKEALITHVSADLSRDEARDVSYYVVLLKFMDFQSNSMGGVELLPGMPADVFITTDQRTVLSYLVKPLTDQFQRAFRE